MLRLWLLSLGFFFLALFLDSCISRRRPPLINDDYSEFFNPAQLQVPSSEAEIVEVVARAGKRQHQVRVLGSGHSRNALSCSQDVTVSLEHYKGIVSLDRQAREVTVKGGTTLAEVVEYLDGNGLALGVLPGILEQTVAGAISTATHGCRTSYGNLAALVTRLRLVTADGSVQTLSAVDNNTDLFQAAQVSLGLLGIITEVTLECEPAFNLEKTFEKRSLDDCLANLEQISQSAEHVKFWLEVYSKSCDIYKFERTEKDVQMNSLIWRNFRMHLWEPFLWLSSWLPSPTRSTIIKNSFLLVGASYSEHSEVGKSYEILTMPLYFPRSEQAELSLDVKDCGSALKTLERVTEKWRPTSVIIEVRFASGDDIWLSMNYHRHSCYITAIIYNPSEPAKEMYFDSLYQELRRMGLKPRPHFGKYHKLSTKDLQDIYPKYADFKRVRSQLDPKGIFLNTMLAKLF